MLDFRMKHEGEPPARLRAHVQMKFEKLGFPRAMADLFLPVMDTADDLDEELETELKQVAAMLERNGVSPERAMEALKGAVEDLIANSEQDEEDDLTASAWLPDGSAGRKKARDLFSAVLNRLRPKSDVKILNHGPSFRAGTSNTRAALSDALQARIDRHHKPTIGRAFAHLSLGEMAMHSVRADGHRPQSMREAIRMSARAGSTLAGSPQSREPQSLIASIGRSSPGRRWRLAPPGQP